MNEWTNNIDDICLLVDLEHNYSAILSKVSLSLTHTPLPLTESNLQNMYMFNPNQTPCLGDNSRRCYPQLCRWSCSWGGCLPESLTWTEHHDRHRLT